MQKVKGTTPHGAAPKTITTCENNTLNQMLTQIETILNVGINLILTEFAVLVVVLGSEVRV